MFTPVFSAAIQSGDAVEVEVNAGRAEPVIVDPIFAFAADSLGFNVGNASKKRPIR